MNQGSDAGSDAGDGEGNRAAASARLPEFGSPPADVRRWMDRRWSRLSEWPMARLPAAKAQGAGTSVGVVLPALNERQTVGEIVACIRTREEAPLVDEILGPLLTDPSVQLVKAAYDRPLLDAGIVLPGGGGRATELVARPLINLRWPQLAGTVQPLAGEYAARGSLLERLPFPCGYVVELGLLVDSLGIAGFDALAQVYVGTRYHRPRRTTRWAGCRARSGRPRCCASSAPDGGSAASRCTPASLSSTAKTAVSARAPTRSRRPSGRRRAPASSTASAW